jgi:Ca-activated chloride channel homolog
MNKIIAFLLVTVFALAVVACAAPQTSSPSQSSSGSNSQTMSRDIHAEEPLVVQESDAKNFLFLLDDSGSMGDRSCDGVQLENNETRMDVTKWATIEIAGRKAVEPDVHVGIHTLNRGKIVPLGTVSPEIIEERVNLLQSGGGTRLHESMKIAFATLDRQRQIQAGKGQYSLVVLTDGQANRGDRRKHDGVQAARDYGMKFYTIGFCLDKEHELARHSEKYRNATNKAELLVIFEEIVAEIEDINFFEGIPGIIVEEEMPENSKQE